MISAAVFLWAYGWDDAQRSIVFSAFVRLAATCSALWLAFPQVDALLAKVSPFWVGLSLLALAVVIIRPKTILVIVPLLVVIGILNWLKRFLTSK